MKTVLPTNKTYLGLMSACELVEKLHDEDTDWTYTVKDSDKDLLFWVAVYDEDGIFLDYL